MYMQARYYDPVIGRFYSNDPVGFSGHAERGNPVHGFNRYAYTNNNPYKFVDPDGRAPTRADQRLDQRVERLSEGEITKEQYQNENLAEGVGGLVATPIAAAAMACGGSGACAAAATAIVSQQVSRTKAGGPRIKQTRANGSTTDITDKRVKEFTPNTHPSAPEGSMQKVKFENAQPGSKGFKRDPTATEKKMLDEVRDSEN